MAGTDSHLRLFNTGVMCSYFVVPVRILAGKFWIFCNFRTLVFLVLAQAVEQKYNLLKTEERLALKFGGKNCFAVLSTKWPLEDL